MFKISGYHKIGIYAFICTCFHFSIRALFVFNQTRGFTLQFVCLCMYFCKHKYMCVRMNWFVFLCTAYIHMYIFLTFFKKYIHMSFLLCICAWIVKTVFLFRLFYLTSKKDSIMGRRKKNSQKKFPKKTLCTFFRRLFLLS